jgi:hypothetical protein
MLLLPLTGHASGPTKCYGLHFWYDKRKSSSSIDD